MKLHELKQMIDEAISEVGEDAEITVQGYNSMYAEDIDCIEFGKGIRSFMGDDYEALILKLSGQVGAVWHSYNLDIDYKNNG